MIRKRVKHLIAICLLLLASAPLPALASEPATPKAKKDLSPAEIKKLNEKINKQAAKDREAGKAPKGLGSDVINCNIIFEQRKAEIEGRIKRLEDRQFAITSLQEAATSILEKKNKLLEDREAKLKSEKAALEAEKESYIALKKQKEEELEEMIKQNKKILDEIGAKIASKVATTYAKMRDSQAAPIIEALPLEDAASILFSLDAKVISKILSKMTPPKAAALTERLQAGPPFKTKAALKAMADKKAKKAKQDIKQAPKPTSADPMPTKAANPKGALDKQAGGTR